MNIREKLDKKLVEFQMISSQASQESSAMIQAEDNESNAEEAQKILQSVAQTIQQEAHNKIASVVSRCLESVFDDPYEFVISFERKRGKTEAHLQFKRNGMLFTDPKNEVGGGVIDLAAFALRLACLVLEKPVRRRILVLDEPFTRIRGEQNRSRMRALLESLSNDFDLQLLICVDHQAYPEFLLGTVVDMG